MENTEQIIPDGNIIMNGVDDDYNVNDADDFYYNSSDDQNDSSVDLASSVQVDPQVFENAVLSEAAPMSDITISSFNDNADDSNEGSNLNLDFNNSTFNAVNTFENSSNKNSIISNSLTSEQINDMIKTEEETKPLDDSYVLSNFDVLFDSLYNDVNGANNFISDLIEQKKTVNVNEANLTDMKNKLEKEREEFAKFVETQKQSIELEKAQCNEYVKNQRIRLQNEEEQFNNDCDATRAQLKLEEEKIKIANEKLENERNQFSKTREIEEEKIRTDRTKLQTEQEQFEKEKTIALERIKQGQKELQSQREQFAKTKELEEKKLELESKNLSQSCARFKELVSQFNSGFQQLPGDRD